MELIEVLLLDGVAATICSRFHVLRLAALINHLFVLLLLNANIGSVSRSDEISSEVNRQLASYYMQIELCINNLSNCINLILQIV